MEKLILICLMILGYVSVGSAKSEDQTLHINKPIVSLTIPNLPTTILNGEVLRIPMFMRYQHLRRTKVWTIYSSGSTWLENASGKCPAILNDVATWHSGECLMYIVIEGKGVGSVITGHVNYHIFGERKGEPFNKYFDSPTFSVKVIPHPLSMAGKQEQSAVAGVPFYYPLRNAVLYYDENMQAYGQVNLTMDDQKKLNDLGLFFDPKSFSIQGTPNQIALSTFKIAAANAHSTAAATELNINVSANPEHKPQFKQNPDILSAAPSKKYRLNLMNLLKNKDSFTDTNTVTFRLASNYPQPDWILPINLQNPTILEGEPTPDLAGAVSQVTIVAHSNTGDDSEPFTISIPVATDPGLKPIIKNFEMEHLAGSQFYTDISNHIEDPIQDKNLKVTIDKIELENPLPIEKRTPEIPRLHFSSNSPTTLEGVIPANATGYKYLITLRAINTAGGTSDPTTISLKVSINKEKTPRFYVDNPNFPMLYPGQDYYYDFVKNRDVFPDYEDVPYEIQFAKDFIPPYWLKLENNKLIANPVPDRFEDRRVSIKLIIKNIPGGFSDEITLRLKVAN